MRKRLNMQYTKWSLLLELYFKGETTLEQELQLRRYFMSSNIASEHEEFIPLFNYINGESELISDFNIHHVKRKRIGRYWKIALSVAAVMVLLVGGILLKHEFNAGDKNKVDIKLYTLMIKGVEVDDRQLAINIAQAKLDVINNAMGRVTEHTGKMAKASSITKKIKVLQILSQENDINQ